MKKGTQALAKRGESINNSDMFIVTAVSIVLFLISSTITLGLAAMYGLISLVIWNEARKKTSKKLKPLGIGVFWLPLLLGNVVLRRRTRRKSLPPPPTTDTVALP